MSNNEILSQNDLAQSMQAIVLHKPNEQFKLTKIELPIPECGDNELLIKVEYVGLNSLDTHFAKQGFSQWQYPHVLGLDAVGTVVKANKGIYPNVGDKVMWHANLAGQGVLSEYAKVANYAVTVVPDCIDPCKAVTLPCAGMTALISLEKLQVCKGDTILIERGAGAVGQFAIQLAKLRGADVFTTASKQNHKLVKCLGADAVFDYQDKNLVNKIRLELGAQGFDAILDSIGGEVTSRNIELMRFCGRIACLKPLPELNPELLFRKAPNISIVSLGGAWLANSLCAQQRMSFISKQLIDYLTKGELKTPEVSIIDFNAEMIVDALHQQNDASIIGKKVVKLVC